jgi:hypothetical protein
MLESNATNGTRCRYGGLQAVDIYHRIILDAGTCPAS